jgi:hypothetical protein
MATTVHFFHMLHSICHEIAMSPWSFTSKVAPSKNEEEGKWANTQMTHMKELLLNSPVSIGVQQDELIVYMSSFF